MAKVILTDEQRQQIGNFLFSDVKKYFNSLNRSEWEEVRSRAYANWFRGGNKWGVLHQGGTGQMYAIIWYQNMREKKNKEWRPAIIIKSLAEHIKSF